MQMPVRRRVYIVEVVSELPKQFMGDDPDILVPSVRVVEPCDKGVCRDYVIWTSEVVS